MTRYDPFSGREWRAMHLQLTMGIQHAMFEIFAIVLFIGASLWLIPFYRYAPAIPIGVGLLTCIKHTRRLTKLSDRLSEDQAKIDADDEHPDI